MKIKELPSCERPYEKLEMYGEKVLSNSELLAIIIKTGTKDYTSVELAQQILKLTDKNGLETLRYLQNFSIEEFMKIKGIGKVKAIQLKAVFEIAKRMSRPINNTKIKVKKSDDVANLIMEEMRYEKREIAKILILNNKNEILKIKDISLGGPNYTFIVPKETLVDAIKMGAPKLILVHNHPSGDSTPSKQDIETTEQILDLSEKLGIQLLDHIVIGDGRYTSIISEILKMHENQKQINE